MSQTKKIRTAFYATASGNEPVREWLKQLSAEDRKVLGEDIADGVKVVNGKAIYPRHVNGSGITLKEKPFPVVIE